MTTLAGSQEVVKFAELEIDLEIRRVGLVAELVLHGEGEVRLHDFEHGVEVVGIHLDKLAFLQLWKGLFRVSGKVSKHAHDKGLARLDLNGAANPSTSYVSLHLSGEDAPGPTCVVRFVWPYILPSELLVRDRG